MYYFLVHAKEAASKLLWIHNRLQSPHLSANILLRICLECLLGICLLGNIHWKRKQQDVQRNRDIISRPSHPGLQAELGSTDLFPKTLPKLASTQLLRLTWVHSLPCWVQAAREPQQLCTQLQRTGRQHISNWFGVTWLDYLIIWMRQLGDYLTKHVACGFIVCGPIISNITSLFQYQSHIPLHLLACI